MKKEDYNYRDPFEENCCHACEYSYLKNKDMTEEKACCHIFQDEIGQWHTCDLWQQPTPEAAPL